MALCAIKPKSGDSWLIVPNHIPAKEARNRAYAVFDALPDFDLVVCGFASIDNFAKFSHFCFDEPAQKIFVEWSDDLQGSKMAAEDHPIIQQHLVKYDKLFRALALILDLIECAATGRRGLVTAESAVRAAAWCDYLEAHARRCYGLLPDDGLRAAQALAYKLRYPHPPTTAIRSRPNQHVVLGLKD